MQIIFGNPHYLDVATVQLSPWREFRRFLAIYEMADRLSQNLHAADKVKALRWLRQTPTHDDIATRQQILTDRPTDRMTEARRAASSCVYSLRGHWLLSTNWRGSLRACRTGTHLKTSCSVVISIQASCTDLRKTTRVSGLEAAFDPVNNVC